MPKLVRAKVKPALIVWARESASYTTADAARRLKVSEARLREWEAGTQAPTVGQLQRMAEAYRRPLGVFYLPEVPTEFQPMRDFRRLPGTGLRRISPELALEIRLAQQRRQLALDLIEEAGEKPERFRLRATLAEDADVLGEKIRSALHVSINEQTGWRTDLAGHTAFNAWRSKIEHQGVLVFQSTRLDSSEVSGFAIAGDTLPVIVVTRAGTPPTRRNFSLLHEFVHLLLRMSGVSDLDVDAARPPEDQQVEVFCNRVAAAALIPAGMLRAEPLVRNHGLFADENWSDETIAELAGEYSVSREALVRRLLTLGLATQTFYQRKRAQYHEEFARQRERKKQESKIAKTEFVTNPPRDALTNFGKPLVQMILGSYYQDRMTLSDVSGYLGLRTRHIPRLEQIVGTRGP
jgi:Zn-dependent peptidase ImmA (M78 family)